MKWVAHVVACVAMLMMGSAMAGCSDGMGAIVGGGSGEPETGPMAEVEPQANINPSDVYFGNVLDGTRSSDTWWANGEVGTEGVYFAWAHNDAGMAIHWVDGNNADTAEQASVEITEDGHLLSTKGAEPEADFMFYDDLTCYDNVTQTWYMRGDAEMLNAEVSGKIYAAGIWQITLADDGTFTDVYGDTTQTGTWAFNSSTTVKLTYDDPTYYPQVVDVITEDGQLAALSASSTWLRLQGDADPQAQTQGAQAPFDAADDNSVEEGGGAESTEGTEQVDGSATGEDVAQTGEEGQV